MLETARRIEGIANAERAPAVLAKPLNPSFKNVKCPPFCMAVKRRNHACGNDTSDYTVIVIVIRRLCEELICAITNSNLWFVEYSLLSLAR
jgi:hypothetical protein